MLLSLISVKEFKALELLLESKSQADRKKELEEQAI